MSKKDPQNRFPEGTFCYFSYERNNSISDSATFVSLFVFAFLCVNAQRALQMTWGISRVDVTFHSANMMEALVVFCFSG